MFCCQPARARQSLATLLRSHLPLSWSVLRRLLQDRSVRVRGKICQDAARRLNAGERVVVELPSAKKPAPPSQDRRRDKGGRVAPSIVGPKPTIRFSDAHVIVVEKPAGLTTMRHAS